MKRLNERMKAWHDQDAFWETAGRLVALARK